MMNRKTLVCVTAAAAVVVATPTLAAAGPPTAQAPASAETMPRRTGDDPQHEHTVETESIRGVTFICGDLTLRATRGTSTETADADLRDGIARISISRIGHNVRLRGSDGRTYRASAFTVAWFVLRAPDFDTPVHGLEVSQIMFRGGPDKSPGWLRERIKWTDKQETESVNGPCDFAE
jgi:hypothetical protein